jgi:hypothetical protein
MNYTQEKLTLIDQFNTKLNAAQQIYANSKIQQDGLVEQKIEEIQNILRQMNQLKKSIADDIDTNTQIIQSIPTTNDVPTTDNSPSYTAKQMMDDSQSLYDQHRILLIIKICIVVLILVKGNAVYAEYKSVFVGASLACIFVYLIFSTF